MSDPAHPAYDQNQGNLYQASLKQYLNVYSNINVFAVHNTEIYIRLDNADIAVVL